MPTFAECARSPGECIVEYDAEKVKLCRRTVQTLFHPHGAVLRQLDQTLHLFFHNVRRPDEMGAAEVVAFLTHLAVNETVAASPDE